MTLFIACAITVAVETAFFALLRYRERDFILLCVCANVLTNLSVNLLLAFAARMKIPEAIAVYPLEALAVLSEYFIYSGYAGKSGKLLALTFLANCLSYGAGLILFGHV